MDRILVLGSTGMLGEPVVNHLLKNGYSVQVLVRDKEKAQSMFGDRVDYLVGDILSIDNLEKALAGCDAVHISVGGPNDPIATKHVLEIGKKSGVKHITYISGSTVCEKNSWFPMIKEKLDAEKMIKASGIPYVIFRPTWPFEQLPRFVRDGRATVFGKQPAFIHWYAREDLGRMIAASFNCEKCSGKTLFIHGPEALTMQEAMERYIKHVHPEITSVSSMPIWILKLIAIMTRNSMLKYVANLMRYFNKVLELGDGKEANDLLGAPETTLDMWIKQRNIEK